jgi:hypothetical protein
MIVKKTQPVKNVQNMRSYIRVIHKHIIFKTGGGGGHLTIKDETDLGIYFTL